ncbi:MAG: hypothetical protein KGL39_56630, partial [Patescibacteria group bacterium]|nr:hypothetical protein [Patescibacteria group bacterium]
NPEMTMKIIQIAATSAPSTVTEHSCWEHLYVLTDDGRIFVKDCPMLTEGEYQSDWKELRLPQ